MNKFVVPDFGVKDVLKHVNVTGVAHVIRLMDSVIVLLALREIDVKHNALKIFSGERTVPMLARVMGNIVTIETARAGVLRGK